MVYIHIDGNATRRSFAVTARSVRFQADGGPPEPPMMGGTTISINLPTRTILVLHGGPRVLTSAGSWMNWILVFNQLLPPRLQS